MIYKSYIKKVSSDVIRDFTSLGNPIILAIISAIFLGITLKLLYIILGMIIIEIICDSIKLLYHKERPNKEEHKNNLEKIRAGSFPSVHSARSIFVFIALFALTPSYILKALFIILPIVIGITRILLKKHYISDVIGGYAIGILILLIFLLTGLI